MDPEKIFVIPHFHYDLAWIYTEEESLKKAYRIMGKVTEIMEKDDDFTYVIDQAYYLEKMKSEKPELFRRVAEKIHEGRIEVVNAGYVMPDLNLVSPLVIKRNFEIMNDFAETEFDTKPNVAWMIDCFGHPGIMPQIARATNLKYYVFWRGMNKPDCTQEFFWTGTDGSTVLAHWMKHSYSSLGNRFSDLAKAVYASEPTTNIVFIPFGDDFYFPHEKLIRQIHKTKNAKFALPSEFFKELEKRPTELPRISGEMLSDYSNFRGYYSSRVSFKQLYRSAEKALLNKEASDDEWKNLLYVTFHDLVCGTGIDEVYPNAERRLRVINAEKKLAKRGKLCPYKGEFLDRISFELKSEEGDLYNTIPSVKATLTENSVILESHVENTSLNLLVQTDFQNPRHVLKLIIRTGIKEGKLTQHFYNGSLAERHLGISYAFNDFFEYKDQAGNGIRFRSNDCFDYEAKHIGDICLTLVRSVQILSHGDAGPRIPCPKALELGKHSFRISLFPIGRNIFL
jgi:Glycosyl hydrolases family 38 N-terminal domain/Alpha mannosidase middle domain